MKRRQFIQASSLALGASYIPTALSGESHRVLVLGGTHYLGPDIVNTLLKHGCKVTLFNRGKTNPNLFPQLELIKGDREAKDGSGLKLLAQHLKTNTYDWVVDTWQKSPLVMPPMAKLLKGKIGSYQYTSTIGVYGVWDKAGIVETSPLRDLEKLGATPDHPRLPYQLRKQYAEIFLKETLGDNVACFRSHGMRSFNVVEPIYEPYWPVRFSRGGEILLPQSEKKHLLQMTDTISYCEFMYHCGVKGIASDFNVAYEPMTFESYIKTVHSVTKQDYEPIWIPEKFLAKNKILPYKDLPFWKPDPAGFYGFDVSKAKKQGLKNRSVADLVRDQLRGYFSRYPNNDFEFGHPGTITRPYEKFVISKWKRELNNSSLG